MIKRKILSALEKEIASDKIIVLTGMRRTGKTTLVRYLYESTDNCRKLFLDLENPLNQSYFSSLDYDAIKNILDRLAQGTAKNLLVVLDEIQNVRTLPSIVKYLYDHYRIKFVLTGSASFYLKHLFSESLAGRKRIFELFPLDFEEFLSYKAPGINKPTFHESISHPLFLLFEKYTSEYFTYGGFPSVVLKQTHEEKLTEIEDIFSSYYQKEVLLLSDFRKLDILKALIDLLFVRIGSKLDVTKIAAELGTSRITIQEYLDFLEATYFIKRIRPYSRNTDVTLRGQPKLYITDNGFLTMKGAIQNGALFENGVYNVLRPYGEMYYYQTKAGAEIDFIIKKSTDTMAFEIKSFARITDVSKLKKLAQKIDINNYFVMSQKFAESSRILFPFQL